MDLASWMLLAVLLPAQSGTANAERDEVSPDVQTVQAAHLSDNEEVLLAFLRRRTHPPDADEAQAAIKRLSDRDASRRQEAAAALIGWGPAVIPQLRQAANSIEDVQRSALARDCLNAIEGQGRSALVQSVVNLLAQRRAAGATELLLAYLPRSEDDVVLEAVEQALRQTGKDNGKPSRALVEAVKDRAPLRSKVAVRVLCQLGGPAALEAVRPLLKDPRATVRMEAAIGLLHAHDAHAFPVLVELVGVLPPAQREQVEALLNEIAGEWAIATPSGQDATSARLRSQLWAAWWEDTNGAWLLGELRKRTLTNDERSEVLKLIAALQDRSAEVRQKASDDLVGRFGTRAAPLLRRASQQPHAGDTETVAKCLEAIERGAPQTVPDALFRLLALRRPGGAVEALLAYAPFAETSSAQDELREALIILGCPEGKPVSEVVKALRDPVAIRRGLAVDVLCRAAGKEHLAGVRKLLEDDDVEVRRLAALGLVQHGHKEAVAVLIHLLGELPADSAGSVESVLTRLAGDKAPSTPEGEGRSQRGAAVEAWQKWWREQGERVDLARLVQGGEDGLVVVENQPQPRNPQGRVLRIDGRGKVRWEIGGLMWPMYARTLPDGKVLVIEQQNRMTLRDRKGKVLWERNHPGVFQVEPLPGGNLLLLCRNEVTALTRQGKVVFSHAEPQAFIMGAGRMPTGHIGYFTNQSSYVRLDAHGKVLKTTHVAIPLQFGINGLEILPRDHILVSLTNNNKVQEYDQDGKVVWEADVPQPGFPHRLANGRTVVVRNNVNEMVEVDRRGKIVSEKKDLAYRPYRVEEP